ncbi:MAG TPA: response regulator [Kouleothrix sp.]|uniref:response regulator n=1 Tax=Kouleothrix sp. TaxID=2779161 RepID=UPI002C94E9F9|nr:response regulator [Kouleothrix sp.]HRC74581.1 response regulator [Kouleothrix sp.]
MSEPSSDNQDRFIHTLVSPLTALRGAIDLLRHPQRAALDPTARDLLDTIERNYLRISGYVEVLLKHHMVQGQVVQISVPLTLLGIEPAPGRALGTPVPDVPEPQLDGSRMEQSTNAQLTYASPSGNGVVLLIGDWPSLAAPIAPMLRQAGYGVLEAINGIDGIDLARAQRPDLVVIDSELPLIGAAQITKVLREDPDTKTIPLLLAVPQQPLTDGHADLLVLNMPHAALLSRINSVIAAARAADTQTPTLLIVDDDADIQRILMLRMQQDGYRVVQAMNGAAALMAAQKQSFDLIILDLLLPDIDGFSVLGALRARNATATTPIILLSARDSAPEKVRGLQLGADDYVTKPFSPAELQARVRAALRRYEREAGANPSTRLPGNIAIERALRRRIEQGVPFAVCYADIDNFKAYNDTYSFLKGDAVIHQTANVLLEAVAQQGNYDDFVGHIGGDDFVVITTPDRAEPIAAYAIRNFDLLSPLFYDPTTRKVGYIDAADRQGRPTRYPFMSLSIAIVSTARHPIQHVAEVAQRSVEPKKRAKDIVGSNFVVEE